MVKIAHRSGPVNFPEQTVKSALDALRMGADMVEIDTRFTSDGKIAVCHDSNAERVFGVNKEIDEMTEDEFRSLRHKDNALYTSHLLEDYLKAGVKPLLIHIKEGGERIKIILNELNRYGYLDDVVIGITEPEDTTTVKNYNKNIPVLAFKGKNHTCEEYANAGVDIIRLWEAQTNKESVEEVKKLGKKVWIMTGNTNGYDVGETSETALKGIISLGVDGVLINDVGMFKKSE